MNTAEVARLVRRALAAKYPTGIAWMEYDPDFNSIGVGWVDGSSSQIDFTIRHHPVGGKWERV